jgi:hypothetical protein
VVTVRGLLGQAEDSTLLALIDVYRTRYRFLVVCLAYSYDYSLFL